MTVETRLFDSARYLDSDKAIAEYVTSAFESGDVAVTTHAFGVAARARGMTKLAKDAGLPRESLYKALSDADDPELNTVLRIARALGLKVMITRQVERS